MTKYTKTILILVLIVFGLLSFQKKSFAQNWLCEVALLDPDFSTQFIGEPQTPVKSFLRAYNRAWLEAQRFADTIKFNYETHVFHFAALGSVLTGKKPETYWEGLNQVSDSERTSLIPKEHGYFR